MSESKNPTIRVENCTECGGRGYVTRTVFMPYYGGGGSSLPSVQQCTRCKGNKLVNRIYFR